MTWLYEYGGDAYEREQQVLSDLADSCTRIGNVLVQRSWTICDRLVLAAVSTGHNSQF